MTEIEKEIEEMAKIADNVSGCRGLGNEIATALHNAHYRPEKEVVKEVLEKLIAKMCEPMVDKIRYCVFSDREINELAAQFGVQED